MISQELLPRINNLGMNNIQYFFPSALGQLIFANHPGYFVEEQYTKIRGRKGEGTVLFWLHFALKRYGSEPQSGPFARSATPQSHSRPSKARPCDGSVERGRSPLLFGSKLTAPSLVSLTGPKDRLPLTSLGKTPGTKAAPGSKRKRPGSTRQNEATPELPQKGDHYSLQAASTSFFSLSIPPFSL